MIKEIDLAFYDLINKKDFKEILNWNIITESAFEQWLQYEYRYYLNKEIVKQNLYIYTEIKKRDFVIYNIKNLDKIIVNIELKNVANWCLSNQIINNIFSDLDKIINYEEESYLILFFTFIKSRKNEFNILYKQIINQLNSYIGIIDYNNFLKFIEKNIISRYIDERNVNINFKLLKNILNTKNEYFDVLKFGAYLLNK